MLGLELGSGLGVGLGLGLANPYPNPTPNPNPNPNPNIVEMAEEGNEGLVYGLLTTTYNLGQPLGRALLSPLSCIFFRIFGLSS